MSKSTGANALHRVQEPNDGLVNLISRSANWVPKIRVGEPVPDDLALAIHAARPGKRLINLARQAATWRVLSMSNKSLYERLGGYDAIAAVSDALMVRIKNDDKLRRFYDHRGADGIVREQQLLVDYLCASSGGPVIYTGRDMKPTHVGMRLDEEDWRRAMAHLTATLDAFQVPEQEKAEVIGFHKNLKSEIVEIP
jgi:hemoglobin